MAFSEASGAELRRGRESDLHLAAPHGKCGDTGNFVTAPGASPAVRAPPLLTGFHREFGAAAPGPLGEPGLRRAAGLVDFPFCAPAARGSATMSHLLPARQTHPCTLIVSSWGGRTEGAPGPCIIRGLNGPAAREGRRGAGRGTADPARVWPRREGALLSSSCDSLPPLLGPGPRKAGARQVVGLSKGRRLPFVHPGNF